MPKTMQQAIDAAIVWQIAEIGDAIAAGVDVHEAIAEARARSTLGPASWQRIVAAIVGAGHVPAHRETQP